MAVAGETLEHLGRAVLRAVVGRDDEVGSGVQVEREPGLDDVGLVAREECHDERHRRGSVRRLSRRGLRARRTRCSARTMPSISAEDGGLRGIGGGVRDVRRRRKRGTTIAASGQTEAIRRRREARGATSRSRVSTASAAICETALELVRRDRLLRRRTRRADRARYASSRQDLMLGRSARDRRAKPAAARLPLRAARATGTRSAAPRSGARRAAARGPCPVGIVVAPLDLDVRIGAMRDLLVRVVDRSSLSPGCAGVAETDGHALREERVVVGRGQEVAPAAADDAEPRRDESRARPSSDAAAGPPELVRVGVDHPVRAELGRGEARHARDPLVLAHVVARPRGGA